MFFIKEIETLRKNQIELLEMRNKLQKLKTVFTREPWQVLITNRIYLELYVMKVNLHLEYRLSEEG